MSPEILIKNRSNELIADLVAWVTREAAIEIRFEDNDDDECAITTLYDYQGDKELSLRLHANDVYDLHLGYYDDEDEFIEIAEVLSDSQKLNLPEKLKKVMLKVLKDEKGMRLQGSLLK